MSAPTYPSPAISPPSRIARLCRIAIWWLYEHLAGLVTALVAVLCQVPLRWVAVGVVAIEILAASAAARRQGPIGSYYQLWRRGARFARRNPQFRLAFEPQIDVQEGAVIWRLLLGADTGDAVGFDDYLPALKQQLSAASDLRLDIDGVIVGRPSPGATAVFVAVYFCVPRSPLELISAQLWSTGGGPDG